MKDRSGLLWRFILLLICLMAAAVNTGNNLLYLILSLMIAVAIVSFALTGRALKRLRAVLHIPEEVVAGRPFIFGVEAIAPRGRFPSPWADAALTGLPGEAPALAIPSLGPGARTVVSASGRALRRGVHDGLRLDLTSRYPFGLFQRRREVRAGAALVVTPRRRRIRSLTVHAPADRGALRTGRPGEGSDLFNIRDYTTQDDARHIHWRASARLHRPMLKEFEREQERALDVVLDERGDAGPGEDEAFERLVETAASLLDHAEEKGIRGRLVVSQGDSGIETLEGRAAMIYLASVRRRADAPPPDRLDEGGGDIPRIVLSLDPSARTEIHVEWAAPGEKA
jgi:uncharacterized protein (DUF58 family)